MSVPYAQSVGAQTFQQLLLLSIAVLCAAILGLSLIRRPLLLTASALASFALVPFWTGSNVAGFHISAHLVLVVLAVIALLLDQHTPLRLTVVDAVMVAMLLISAVSMSIGKSPLDQTYTIAQWLISYLFGRLAVDAYGLAEVSKYVAIPFGLAAGFLAFEYLTSINLWTRYLGMDNSLYATWGTLQTRGGTLRTEGAFGHSIAAGSCLAMASLLTVGSNLRPWLKVSIVTVMLGAIVTTFSRIGMITAALGLLAVALVKRDVLPRQARLALVTVLSLGAIASAWWVFEVFSAAGSESANSASYRWWLLELVPSLNPLTQASTYVRSTSGIVTFGAFRSVDNAILFLALRSGWILALAIVVLLAAAAIRTLRGRADVATIAVAAQIPALFSVALITQYSTVLWVIAGMAVTATFCPDWVPQRAYVAPTFNDSVHRHREQLRW